MLKKFLHRVFVFLLNFILLLFSKNSFLLTKPTYAVTNWYSSNWGYRKPIIINNTENASDLTNYQVKISVTYDSDMQADFDDIRFTDSDGTTLISHWLESKTNSSSAIFWVKVPNIPGLSEKTIYMYYGNSSASSASNGDDTFEFFDDFENPDSALGYFSLSSPITVLPQDQPWELTPPHTLSIVEANMGGYKYWGYYGTAGANEGVGLAFSNDLVNWVKYESNPIITNARWPSALKVGDTFYLTYDKNYSQPGDGYITLASSTDGITFNDVKNLVSGEINNNNLFLDPNDNTYYLYYRDIYSSMNGYNIQVKHAENIEDLDTATPQSTGAYGAAPNMFYYKGKYILATETSSKTGGAGGWVGSWTGVWLTYFYESDSPTSGFTPLPNNPVIADGNACPFQFEFSGTLYLYTCYLDASTNEWSIQLRTADTSLGRNTVYKPSNSKWISNSLTSSSWQVINTAQHNEETGYVLRGHVNNRSTLLTKNYSGSDYMVEAYGQQIGGRNWGLVSRSDGTVHNIYFAPLYEDIDSGNNLYLYRFLSDAGATLGRYSTGTINKNTWYKLSLSSLGSSFKSYFNNTLGISAIDSTFTSGKVGIYTEGSNAESVEILVDDFLVRKITSPEPLISVGTEESPTATIDLISPQGYISNRKPTLSFKKAINTISPINSYSVTVDSNKNKSFSTTNIPTSGNGTTSYVWKDNSEARVEFLYENDSDSTNDEVRVYLKNLDSDELSEGKHSWKVTAYDNASNAIDSSTDFYIDLTPPFISELAIANIASVSRGEVYKLDIVNRIFSFSGKASDPYRGSEKTNTNGTKDIFDKVASGPDKITLTLKKLKQGENPDGKNPIYEDYLIKEYTLSGINNKPDNEKYSRFFITIPYPLEDGYYQVNLSLKDKAGNAYNHPVFYLALNYKKYLIGNSPTLTKLKTEIIKEEKIPAEIEEKEKIKEEGYTVKVKVVDINKNPVKGAKVTLYSEPKKAFTDEKGMATFYNVKKGEHKIVIAYKGQTGEQKVNLEGEVKEFNFTIQMKQTNSLTLPIVILPISIFILIIIFLLVWIYKFKRKEMMS